MMGLWHVVVVGKFCLVDFWMADWVLSAWHFGMVMSILCDLDQTWFIVMFMPLSGD
jgi:hypothetical protein